MIMKEYNIIKKLSQGTYGDIWLVKDQNQYKVIKRIFLKNTKKNRIINEINAGIILNHSNIIKVYDYWEDVQFFYIVIDYIHGYDLFTCLKQNKIKIGDEITVKKIFIQILNLVINFF